MHFINFPLFVQQVRERAREGRKSDKVKTDMDANSAWCKVHNIVHFISCLPFLINVSRIHSSLKEGVMLWNKPLQAAQSAQCAVSGRSAGAGWLMD